MQNRIINVSSYRNFQSLTEINDRAYRDPEAFIAECEAEFDQLLAKAAEYIIYSSTRVIMLAGPSASGKTTTSKRLAEALQSFGYKAHTVELDDYFFTLDQSDTSMNWESPARVDMKLLTEQIAALQNGEEVLMPDFDFETGTQHLNVTPLQLGRNEVVIFEGIHALNDAILSHVPDSTLAIYISARMRVRDETHVIFRPEWCRFLRRGLRDSKFRGTDLNATLARWSDVRRGEQIYITPSKRRASIMLDTSLDYEINVLAPLIADQVNQLDREMLGALRMSRLYTSMQRFHPIESRFVPERSVLREFIGQEE